MSHAIEEHDMLAVGYTSVYGEAWHRHENCTHCDEEVPLQFAEEIFDFEVEKYPCFVRDLEDPEQFVEVPGQYHLIDKSTGLVLSKASVRDVYTVVQNKAWLDGIVLGVLSQYDTKIESCGTLFNRKKAFMNLVVMEHTVKGDVSPTRTRILYTNAFDNCSYSACVNQIRVVCNNTLRAASAQGEANKTLRKFRHTAKALDAIGEYTVELAEVVAAIEVHNGMLDRLAELQASPAYVKSILSHLFKFEDDADDSRHKTIAQNKVEAVTEIFETKDDLNSSPIKGTRYALLNAITDWADHHSTVRNGTDSMAREWAGIMGNKDKVKQRAVDLLMPT